MKIRFLFLTIAAGALMAVPHLNFQDLLSQGDHGRDLYAAQEALKGKLPYKDFWWVYGPLMPYYYALFLKIFGAAIPSILLGYAVMKVAAGAFFYLTAAVAMPASVAFLGACWFMQSQQDFFFTYNHISGITLEMFICWRLFAYIANGRLRGLWSIVPAILLYALIKVNFALAALAVTALAVGLTDFVREQPLDKDKKYFYATLLAGTPVLIAVVYWLLLKDLPVYAVHQCMPYFGDDQPHHYPPSITIPYYFTQHWLTIQHAWMGFAATAALASSSNGSLPAVIGATAQFLNLVRHIVMHAATLGTLWLLLSRRFAGEQARNFLLCLAVLVYSLS